MSSIKNPKDKKLMSLKHDRRNAWGENAKSSRKNIPLSKQRNKQAARANVAQVLAVEITTSAKLDLERIDSSVKDREVVGKRRRFKKWPDTPLISVLLRKKADLWVPKDAAITSKTAEKLRQKLRDR